jgi:nucleotidyltransferase substrate binding protein (TIGR01987 family)
MNQDIRWHQRFSNYSKALKELESAVILAKKRELTKLEKQGLIQCFEYTQELAWKTLKDFLEDRGVTELFGSKDAVREAFKLGILTDGEVWMEMIKSRNLTSRTYDEQMVSDIAKIIADVYFHQFQDLFKSLSKFI